MILVSNPPLCLEELRGVAAPVLNYVGILELAVEQRLVLVY